MIIALGLLTFAAWLWVLNSEIVEGYTYLDIVQHSITNIPCLCFLLCSIVLTYLIMEKE